MTTYTWCVEIVSGHETADYAADEIMAHEFATSYQDALDTIQWLISDDQGVGEYPEGTRFEVVLVRNDIRGRSWAYVENGRLMDACRDAYGNQVAVTPIRFIREVRKASGK